MNGLVKDLTGLIGESKVLFQPEDLLAYANDATHYFRTQPPDAVVLPTSTEEISRVLSYAYEHYIPVTPRGAGSGLSGGATPVKGGIVVDTKTDEPDCGNRPGQYDRNCGRRGSAAELPPGG